MPTVYKSEALITTVVRQGDATTRLDSIEGLSGIIGYSGASSSGIGIKGEQSLAILKSRVFLINYIKEKNIKHLLFPDKWNEIEKKWKDQEPTNYEAYKLLKGMIFKSSNKEQRGAKVLNLGIKWKNPKDISKIKYIVNSLIHSLNFLVRNDEIKEAERSIVFLKNELASTDLTESRKMLYSLIESRMRAITIAKSRSQFVFKIIDPAITPLTPESKNSKLIIIFASLFGLIIGSLFVVIYSLTRRKYA